MTARVGALIRPHGTSLTLPAAAAKKTCGPPAATACSTASRLTDAKYLRDFAAGINESGGHSAPLGTVPRGVRRGLSFVCELRLDDDCGISSARCRRTVLWSGVSSIRGTSRDTRVRGSAALQFKWRRAFRTRQRLNLFDCLTETR
jgi:hypothetical protein